MKNAVYSKIVQRSWLQKCTPATAIDYLFGKNGYGIRKLISFYSYKQGGGLLLKIHHI
ncbi:hypothetical protein FLA_6371 [Filimonas lacunae]|nr:hypothetical protein FLA_6371 [Filimonas lacunae]